MGNAAACPRAGGCARRLQSRFPWRAAGAGSARAAGQRACGAAAMRKRGDCSPDGAGPVPTWLPAALARPRPRETLRVSVKQRLEARPLLSREGLTSEDSFLSDESLLSSSLLFGQLSTLLCGCQACPRLGMDASSPGWGLRRAARPDSGAVCAGEARSSPPPREKLPAHVVHDDATRAALDALVEAHYPCAVVRSAAAARRRPQLCLPVSTAAARRLRLPQPLTRAPPTRRRCVTPRRPTSPSYTVRTRAHAPAAAEGTRPGATTRDGGRLSAPMRCASDRLRSRLGSLAREAPRRRPPAARKPL